MIMVIKGVFSVEGFPEMGSYRVRGKVRFSFRRIA